jgi:hypothetical protein
VAQIYSGIQDVNAKTDFEYFPSQKQLIKAGLNYTYHTFTPIQNKSPYCQLSPVFRSISNFKTLIINSLNEKIKNIISIILLLCIFLASCEKNIDILPPAYESKISIQCMLTPDSFPKLYLGKSVPYFNYAVLPKELFLANPRQIDKALKEYKLYYKIFSWSISIFV